MSKGGESGVGEEDVPVSAGVRLGGRYEIGVLLGMGGMGSVFAAHDTALDRGVAVKLLPAPKWRDGKASSRLLREARAMARVAGDGVAQVFDHGIDDVYGPYLVMERLEGRDLAQLLHARGRLPVDVALAFVEQIGATVQAAHGRGIVHRDLKPSNFFVCRAITGGRPRVKVLDFGLAKAEGDEGALTHPGDVIGTLAYLPPEGWVGDDQRDARSDIYALGATLYEMLAGEPPFRATTRAALRLAIANDPPAPLESLRPDVPPAVARAVHRAMNKTKGARFDSVAAFVQALGLVLPAPASTPSLGLPPSEFRGTARYQVDRVLSSGQHAVVYGGRDVVRDRAVALKVVRAGNAEAVVRLKREHRVAGEIRHPNLARVDDLLEVQGELVLVMELVDGEPLLEHVAGSQDRLASALGQLVGALDALHARRLAHCDVKPQNVLVEQGGRVVLLDCGLASPWGARRVAEGTTAYMAPEALEGAVGPERDFYALGVVLHEALTGKLPSRTSRRKRSRAAARPDRAGPLRDLCSRLLDPAPSSRATAADVVRVVGAPARLRSLPEVFVGRRDELAVLSGALAAAARGRPATVWIEGTSGMGKTALLDRFCRVLEDEGRALVLRGRAREETSAPYPALDHAIEDLGTHLNRLPAGVAERIVPEHDRGLTQLFPVLARVPAIARAKRVAGVDPDLIQVHRRAADALHDLLRRLAQRAPLVLVVDDLQWLDRDSASLLVHLLGGGEPAAVLFVGAVRTDGADAGSADLETLEAKLATPIWRVPLGPLSIDESAALLRERWRRQASLDESTAVRLARRSGGSPFFVDVLASESGSATDGEDALEGALLARYRRLDPVAREGLELLCLSTRPLRPELLASAVGAVDPAALDALRSDSLVRVTRSEEGWTMEPRHTVIREVVRGVLDPDTRRVRHRRLADQLRGDPRVEAEVLVEHLSGCGDPSAAEVAVRAAWAANEHLAFDRAASLFAVAAACVPEGAERIALVRWQARSHQNAGRRRRAGQILLEIAGSVGDAELQRALRREAGEHLLLSGDVGPGLEVLGPTLRAFGLELPLGPADVGLATLTAVGALAARGFTPSFPPPPSPLSPGHDADGGRLERIDLFLLLARGLALVDLRALLVACRALHEALDAGEPRRLAYACAIFVVAAAGHVPDALVDAPLALGEGLAGGLRDPFADALVAAAQAQRAHFRGDFLAAEAGFERSEHILLESCTDATREIALVRDLAVFIQYAHKGDFRSQLDRTQRWLSEAQALRDPFHASMLRVAHAIVWIAHDEPERAREELRRAESEGSGAGGTLEIVASLYDDIIERYEAGQGSRAGGRRDAILQGHAEFTPFLTGYLLLHRTWWALRAAARGEAAEARAITRAIADLRNFGMEVWTAVADALESNWWFLQGERDRALQCAERSERTFRRQHMLCLAACARKRRGQFMRGALGVRLQDEGDAELRALGVVDVERWSRAYWSVYDADAATALTTKASVGDA